MRWTLLDVREKWEVDTASIPGVVWIPMAEIPGRFEEIDRKQPLAVICHAGGRSRRVAEFLASQGFTQVVNVAGGIDAWAEQVDPGIPRY